MHTQDWVFYGRLKRHLVQIKHQPYGGNILVCLNGTTLFDETLLMSVEQKSYSFFVDGELCVIEIHKKGKNDYKYHFIAPEFSTSTQGQAKKRQDLREKLFIGGGVTMALIGLLFFIRMLHNSDALSYNLEESGFLTTAYVTHISIPATNRTTDSAVVRYQFIANGERILAKQNAAIHQKRAVVPPHLIPINFSDEFEVLFAGNAPEANRIFFDKPSERQLLSYHLAARDSCENNTLFATMSPKKRLQFCDCLAQKFYQTYGIVGLARLLYQNSSVQQHPLYNVQTFKSFYPNAVTQIDEWCKAVVE